jgi:hypothetical protein
MNEDLRRLDWPELLEQLRDHATYWLLAYNEPGSVVCRRRSPDSLEEISSEISEDNDRLAELGFEIARRVWGYRSGALPDLRREGAPPIWRSEE